MEEKGKVRDILPLLLSAAKSTAVSMASVIHWRGSSSGLTEFTQYVSHTRVDIMWPKWCFKVIFQHLILLVQTNRHHWSEIVSPALVSVPKLLWTMDLDIIPSFISVTSLQSLSTNLWASLSSYIDSLSSLLIQWLCSPGWSQIHNPPAFTLRVIGFWVWLPGFFFLLRVVQIIDCSVKFSPFYMFLLQCSLQPDRSC